MTFFARILAMPVRAYRFLLSPLLRPSCRYYPSCSDYALQALERHGAGKGLWLATKRLSRCHPWGGSGLDPVPGTADWDRVNSAGFKDPDAAGRAACPNHHVACKSSHGASLQRRGLAKDDRISL